MLALSAISQTASYRYARVLGCSHTRLALHLLRNNLSAACRWVLLPLVLTALVLAYDVRNTAVLSVHTMTAELIAWSAALTLASTLTGTLAGWAFLAVGSRRRPGGSARPRYGIALLTYTLALIMVWSFSTASSTLTLNILEAQELHSQAQAQRSLPPAVSLSIWNVSESTFGAKIPQITSFISDAQQEGRLVLAYAVPDGSVPDGSKPPVLYLNGTAASHYGLPGASDGEVTLYRARNLSDQDASIRQNLVDLAHFNALYGASSSNFSLTVDIRDQEETSGVLPADLPQVSYFLSTSGTRISDCLVAVVPDGFFSPDNYFSVITQGAAVFTDRDVDSLREDLRAHHAEDLVARLDAVGAAHSALMDETMRLVALHTLILLAAAAGAVTGAGLAARSWAQVLRRRREIGRLLGQNQLTGFLLTAFLITLPVLVLAWPLLLQPVAEQVLPQAACAVALIVAAVVGARQATARSTRSRRRRPARHG